MEKLIEGFRYINNYYALSALIILVILFAFLAYYNRLPWRNKGNQSHTSSNTNNERPMSTKLKIIILVSILSITTLIVIGGIKVQTSEGNKNNNSTPPDPGKANAEPSIDESTIIVPVGARADLFKEIRIMVKGIKSGQMVTLLITSDTYSELLVSDAVKGQSFSYPNYDTKSITYNITVLQVGKGEDKKDFAKLFVKKNKPK